MILEVSPKDKKSAGNPCYPYNHPTIIRYKTRIIRATHIISRIGCKAPVYITGTSGFASSREACRGMVTLLHEAQIPLDLFEISDKIDNLGRANRVGPFYGKRTTAVAAQNLDRHFIGFEISREFCSIANEYLNETVKTTKKQIKSNQSSLFK